MADEEKNATIESVSLGIEDHGILTAFVYLDYGDAGVQGFGGYALGGTTACAVFIRRCLEIGGVDEWKCLPGKTVRVRSDYAKVEAIGHITKDDWFNPASEFAKMTA